MLALALWAMFDTDNPDVRSRCTKKGRRDLELQLFLQLICHIVVAVVVVVVRVVSKETGCFQACLETPPDHT